MHEMDPTHSRYTAQFGFDLSDIEPRRRASSRTCPASRGSRQPDRRIRTDTAMDSNGSADSQPKNRMTHAAAIAAPEPKMSLSTCARAPRSLSELAPDSTAKAARFEIPPIAATPNMSL